MVRTFITRRNGCRLRRIFKFMEVGIKSGGCCEGGSINSRKRRKSFTSKENSFQLYALKPTHVLQFSSPRFVLVVVWFCILYFFSRVPHSLTLLSLALSNISLSLLSFPHSSLIILFYILLENIHALLLLLGTKLRHIRLAFYELEMTPCRIRPLAPLTEWN